MKKYIQFLFLKKEEIILTFLILLMSIIFLLVIGIIDPVKYKSSHDDISQVRAILVPENPLTISEVERWDQLRQELPQLYSNIKTAGEDPATDTEVESADIANTIAKQHVIPLPYPDIERAILEYKMRHKTSETAPTQGRAPQTPLKGK
jgi:hypothetical protein